MGVKLEYAIDIEKERCIFQNFCEVLDKATDQVNLIVHERRFEEMPDTTSQSSTTFSEAFAKTDRKRWQNLTCDTLVGNEESLSYFSNILFMEWRRGFLNRIRVKSSVGVQEAYRRRRTISRKANAVRYVFKISETEGL